LPATLRRELGRAVTGTAPPPSADVLTIRLDRPLDESVRSILAAALALEDGNRSRAARRLGVSLRTMQRFAARGSGSARTGSRH
jgi:DNA-binding NtrC family response regulator